MIQRRIGVAAGFGKPKHKKFFFIAFVAQQVEHHHGKVGVTGSIPVKGSTGSKWILVLIRILAILKIKKNNG
jgi:hypothetical protein